MEAVGNRRCRSAELHSSTQRTRGAAQCFAAFAECNSAIQQIENLRYDARHSQSHRPPFSFWHSRLPPARPGFVSWQTSKKSPSPRAGIGQARPPIPSLAGLSRKVVNNSKSPAGPLRGPKKGKRQKNQRTKRNPNHLRSGPARPHAPESDAIIRPTRLSVATKVAYGGRALIAPTSTTNKPRGS